jgi:hypothetical protein
MTGARDSLEFAHCVWSMGSDCFVLRGIAWAARRHSEALLSVLPPRSP